jgi:hypothetical protein
MHLSRRVLPALFVAWAGAIDVYAEPVQITSGFLNAVGVFDTADFQFIGADFLARGGAEPGVIGPELTCFPCSSGDTISLNTRYAGTIGSGTATIEGTPYSGVTFGGELTFQSASAAAPSIVGGFTITQPFTFTAQLMGFLNYNTTEETRIFDRLLAGSGIVTATFGETPSEGVPLFSFQSVRYDFASDAAVPEPATLLLFGSGLAAAALRKRFGKSC